jgi:hypothetical protein
MNDTARITHYAALLSALEIGIGGVLHALRIPFAGHILSLNQGVILSFAARLASSRRDAISWTSGISCVAGVLKALAPVGKRLTPMLAIVSQGFLFSLGIAIGGNNVIGTSLGMAMLSVWGFLQSCLVAYLLFGTPLFQAITKLWVGFAQSFSLPLEWGWLIIAFVVGTKVGIGVFLAARISLSKESFETKYLSTLEPTLERWKGKQPVFSSSLAGRPAVAAFKDLLNVWFLLALALSTGLLFLSDHVRSEDVWLYVLRPIAAGWLFFWLVRSFPRSWIQNAVRHFPLLSKSVSHLKKLGTHADSNLSGTIASE